MNVENEMPKLIIQTSLLGTAAAAKGMKATAVLDRCSVMFVLPDGDDRDHDTGISVFLRKQDGKAMAGDPNVAPGQHFSDPGTYGPYNLPIQTANIAVADFKGGFCEVIISPSGNDHWETNIVILSHFTDGTVIHSQSGHVGLDEEHTTLRFGL
jgi:hypothetical protein